MAQQDSGMNVISNGAKLVGETLLPGASLLMDGKFVNGVAHTAIGLGAKMALGPIGLLLVCADSFSKSTTDKFIWDHVSDLVKSRKQAQTTEVEAAA